jgi:hypothetical protein
MDGCLNSHFNIFSSEILSSLRNNSLFLSVFLNRNIMLSFPSLISTSLALSLPPSVSNVLLFHSILLSILTDHISLYITNTVHSYTVISAILQTFSKYIFSIYNLAYQQLRRRQAHRTPFLLIDSNIKI